MFALRFIVFVLFYFLVYCITDNHQYIKYKTSANNNDCSISHKCGSSIKRIPVQSGQNQIVEIGKEITPCKIANIIILPENIYNTNQLLLKASSDGLVHKMIIEAVDVTAAAVGDLIDEFISTNIWWVIRKEIYNHNISTSNKVFNGSNHVNSNSIHIVVLIRYKQMYEDELRLISGLQNPPIQDICDNTTLYIARMINSGWGSLADMIISNLDLHHTSIFNIWYTRFNTPNESFGMIHYKDCKDGLINKWECLFLPLTNCSMDNVAFTKCHDEDPRGEPMCFPEDFFKVKNMSVNGGDMIDADSECGSADKPRNPYQLQLMNTYQHDNCDEVQRAPFLTAQNEQIVYSLPAREVFETFALTFRPNYNLRSRLTISIREAQETKSIPFILTKTTCVAIHIRRGDRAIKGLNGPNMKQFCDRFTKDANIVRDNCTDELLLDMAKHPQNYNFNKSEISTRIC